jgi:hypothetical protein
MLEQVVRTGEGFTALTHVTARQADTLRWTEEQIQTMIVKRFVANNNLAAYLGLKREQIDASATYRTECFNAIFPTTVFKGSRQSTTIRWICNRCADGRGVITPCDVLDLLIRARQKQQDICGANPEGTSDDTPEAYKCLFRKVRKLIYEGMEYRITRGMNSMGDDDSSLA